MNFNLSHMVTSKTKLTFSSMPIKNIWFSMSSFAIIKNECFLFLFLFVAEKKVYRELSRMPKANNI